MDQQALCGIGNLYASEILFHAGVHPQRRCSLLRADHWKRIHAAMRRVLLEAIRCEGSTLADGTYRVGRSQRGGYQSRHCVYQRSQRPCPHCGRAVAQEWSSPEIDVFLPELPALAAVEELLIILGCHRTCRQLPRRPSFRVLP